MSTRRACSTTTFGNGGIANNIVLPGVTESYQFAVQGDNYILAGYGRGEDAERGRRSS